jgi:hypothetical protein
VISAAANQHGFDRTAAAAAQDALPGPSCYGGLEYARPGGACAGYVQNPSLAQRETRTDLVNVLLQLDGSGRMWDQGSRVYAQTERPAPVRQTPARA